METKTRAWWAFRQGFGGGLAGRPPAEVLEQAGWARSVGGVGPYLTLFSRAGTSRQAVDEAVAKLQIHELPSARGCTYVVPASDFALALAVGQGFGYEQDMKTARKLGVTDGEIERLCSTLLEALEQGPMEPDVLRESAGGAVRNLGEEGKKKGLTTTLPLALGKLQAAGEIRRVPVNGRLDQQRYRYALWRPNPLTGFHLSQEEAYTELARKFFRWIGPATLGEFQWFSGLGARVAKSAVDPLGLCQIENRLMFPEDFEAFQAFRAPHDPQYVLVSNLDGILHLRRDLKSVLAPEDAARQVFSEKGLKELGGLADLSHQAIFDRGRVVGLWDYDTTTASVAWQAFVKKDSALQAAVHQTEQFVREQLGDARSFSLDTPKSRVSRLAALRDSDLI